MTQHIDQSEDAAFALFDSLEAISAAELVGLWKGRCVPTGHPMDGVLENLGWFGKRFNADMSADPLLFSLGARRLVPLDPAAIPVGWALRFHRFGRTRLARNLFPHLARYLRARGPVAKLRVISFRNVASAAMVYDSQPIVDHFRKIDDDAVLGALSIHGKKPHYFFRLDRVEGSSSNAPEPRQHV